MLLPCDGENVVQRACPTNPRGKGRVLNLNPPVTALVLGPAEPSCGRTLVSPTRCFQNPLYPTAASCGVIIHFPLHRLTEPNRNPSGGYNLPPACTPPELAVLTLHGKVAAKYGFQFL